ncbi:MAG: transglycosylase domain-containing protein [Bacilli bacterium]|nr:transglycosylase domain-containing protein [Bacilli bacterium]
MRKIKKRKKTSQPSTVKVRRRKLAWNIKLAILLALILILLVCYVALGIKYTAIVAMMMFIVFGIGFIATRKGRKRRKLISIILIMFFTLGIICLVGFSVFIIYIKGQADPKYEKSKLNTLEMSRIYDKDGVEIAKLGSEKREKVTYDELPEVLVDAIIATEDSRFFQHNGFDAPRFIKATIGQLTRGSEAGGASTLSMQVTKNSFTDPLGQASSGVKGIIRKFEDIYITVFMLEKDYSKEQIIEFYVNNHFLGGNIYGVEEASNAYFGKSVSELNLSEAAILAGMFKSPNYYRPTTNPENAAKRRKTVLYYMRKAGYITKEEEEAANAIPVESLTADIANSNVNPYQGFIDTVAEELEEKYGVSPYTTPLLVYTTLDRGRQDAVSKVLSGENYSWIDDRVQSGVAVLESQTGKILAIGNGRNINSRSQGQARQYNYATQIKRQPGSTAKPLFDYGPGIEYNNWSTYEPFDDSPYSYSNGRSIKNWDGGYFGKITLRRALSTSRNIPALKAFQRVDNEKIKEFVTGLGLTPEICASGYKYDRENNICVNKEDKNDTQATIGLHEAHSIGAFTGVSPLEMAAAYAAFSNGGYYNEPYSVTKFVYRQTGVTVEHQSEKKQVMSEATAFMISSVLQDVALTGGTPHNVACKTGTTNFDENTMNDYNMPWDAIRDSWVIGYSTQTTIGMWYGYDSFTRESIAQGYVLHNIPATIQKDRLFLALVYSGAMEANRSDFVQPASVTKVGISPNSDPPKLAIPGQASVQEYFKKGTEPTEYDFSNYKLPAPGNFKITDDGTKVTLSWGAVSPGDLVKEDHGTFGYNVYKDGVLITWTDKTTYTFTPTGSIYGTYKIIATYKSYNDIQSNAAEKKYEKVTITCPSDATVSENTCVCKDSNKEYDATSKTCKEKQQNNENENE